MDENDAIFHFKKKYNRKEFTGRVFSNEGFNITFSNTKQQNDKFVMISFDANQSRMHGSSNIMGKNNEPIFEFGKLNEFTINLTDSSLTFYNPKFSEYLMFEGNFQSLEYVGFDSESLTTWIVNQSKIEIFF